MKLFLRVLLALVIPVQLSLAQQKKALVHLPTPKATEIKWYPGHYLTLASEHEREKWTAIAGQQHFAGGQRIYTWRQLEPAEGQYAFSAIEADLALLRGQNQRLILEIWDNSFDGHTLPLPDYLLTPDYKGGIARPEKNPRVTRAKRWIPAVMDRYIRLMEALGQRFDRDPYFAGLIHTETAMENKGKGFEDFNAPEFDKQMHRLVAACRKAFPTTPVLVYGNWYPYRGTEGLAKLARAAQEQGAGWGGPDLMPGRHIWGYDIIRANAGRMPLGLSAQWDSYSGKWTVHQLLDGAIKELKLNFVFWGCYERKKSGGLSFSKDVIPAIEAADSELITQKPTNLTVADK